MDARNTVLSEDEEQILFCRWMRMQHPELKFFAIPNGGKRSIVTATKLKMSGVSAGVPDIFIPALKLFIEMKRAKGGVVSEFQKKWIEYLNTCGYKAVICRGCNAARAEIELAILNQKKCPA